MIRRIFRIRANWDWDRRQRVGECFREYTNACHRIYLDNGGTLNHKDFLGEKIPRQSTRLSYSLYGIGSNGV